MRCVTRSLCALGAVMLVMTALADLRSGPSWYEQNAVNVAPDWHYRVPINLPVGAPANSTIKLDVDFVALLAQLGVSGTFDSNSPRVVRSTGALSTYQQFTDTVYGGATSPVADGKGEIRFISEDAGGATYYLYFDITGNGAKPANPQTPINGNFEFGGSGTTTPSGWSVSTTPGFDAQIRPSETVTVTDSSGSNDTVSTDGTPYTGAYSYLLGARSGVEANNTAPAVTLTKTFVKPASCSSGLSLRYRPEGWDSSWANASQYDFIRITVSSGATSTVIVGPNGAGYSTYPYSPNFSSSGSNAISNNQSGYGQYNYWDLDSLGRHRGGTTLTAGSQPWFNPTNALSSFGSGSTITLTITTNHTTQYRSWFHIDDVEWCVAAATLGTPEAFGVNIIAPSAATTFTAGQKLTIRAQVDAQPTASGTPVTANVYDNSGNVVASGIVLYNDGTHGDATANDAIWSNDGSIVANPTYTIPIGATSGANWKVRVFAKDASTSSIGATNGLIHVSGQANTEIQNNFYNIDEQTFSVSVPALQVVKSSEVLSDPVNGTTNPKRIPGAIVRYTITVTNTGAGSVDASSLAIVDAVPANTIMYVSTGSGNPVEFIDGATASGLSFNYASNVGYSNIAGGVAPFTYSPTPDANGFNAAVTGVRIAPSGTMSGVSSGNPSFTIRFRVKIN